MKERTIHTARKGRVNVTTKEGNSQLKVIAIVRSVKLGQVIERSVGDLTRFVQHSEIGKTCGRSNHDGKEFETIEVILGVTWKVRIFQIRIKHEQTHKKL